jgi:chromosome segregation protein
VRARVVADEAKLADLASEREKLDEQLAQQRAELARAEAEVAALAAVLDAKPPEKSWATGCNSRAWQMSRSYGRRYRLRHSGKPRWKPYWASGSPPVPPSEHSPRCTDHWWMASSPPALPANDWPRLLDQLTASAPFDAALPIGWTASSGR